MSASAAFGEARTLTALEGLPIGAPLPFVSARTSPSLGLTRGEVAAMGVMEERFREAYVQVFARLQGKQAPVIGVTSALRGEGRTSTAIGIALAIAGDLDVPVLLIDLDFQRPAIAGLLGLMATPGATDVVDGTRALHEALQRPASGRFDVLTAGSAPSSPIRVHRSPVLRQVIDAARTGYFATVLDLPPAQALSDVDTLGSLADAILLAVRANVTPARLIDRAIGNFEPGKVAGVVLNGYRSSIPRWLQRFL